MGFPEKIAEAQRDALARDVQRARDDLDRLVGNMRAVDPHNVAMSRDEYDAVVAGLRFAWQQLLGVLDTIDEAVNRKEK